MEELERDAAPLQHLVDRREDGVAHARVHLEHDVPDVPEDDAERGSDGHASRHVGLVHAAVRVGKRRVVERLDHGGLHGLVLRAVAVQPLAKLEPVERLEPPQQHVVGDEAARVGEGQVDDDPRAAEVVAGGGVHHVAQVDGHGRQHTVQLLRDSRVPPHARRQKGCRVEGGTRAYGHHCTGIRADVQCQPGAQPFDERRGTGPVRAARVRHEHVVKMVAREVDHPLQQLVHIGQIGVARAWKAVVVGKLDQPALEAGVEVLQEQVRVRADEGALHGGQRVVGRTSQLVVHLAHHPKRVVVEAEPDVEPVLLDAAMLEQVAATGSLAAETPPQLVDGHVVAARREFKRRGEGAQSSTQNGGTGAGPGEVSHGA